MYAYLFIYYILPLNNTYVYIYRNILKYFVKCSFKL